jgi:hypothetical protein
MLSFVLLDGVALVRLVFLPSFGGIERQIGFCAVPNH